MCTLALGVSAGRFEECIFCIRSKPKLMSRHVAYAIPYVVITSILYFHRVVYTAR